MSPPLLDNSRARRLFLDLHLLLRPGSGPGRGGDLDGVLHALGFVQVDSVNTLARAHDLILWSRRGQYRPEALTQLVARRRTAFEHWTHDAAVIPMAFYPMWRLKFARDEARLRARWPEWRREGWQGELGTVLDHIRAHGPTSSLDVGEGEARGSSGWWDWHPSKTALEFLWRSGRLAVCHRQGFRKFYDLAERVIPPEHLNTRRDDAEIVDWAMMAALDRLGFATSGELAAFFEIVTREEARAWTTEALSAKRIVEAEIEMADGTRRRSLTTEALLDRAATLAAPSSRVRLLSPFDPALRERTRAERLFGFRYRIEIFVPAAKRRYGYYVFPVFQGTRAIGRLDARRTGKVLRVRAFWPEAGVAMGKARLGALRAELERVGHLAGIEEIDFAPEWIRAPSQPVCQSA
ncbi:MAG: crosslink repair DNA glycosylase YcaQ family protein [Pseudomonadota bacterium]